MNFSRTLGMRLRGAYLTFHRRANARFDRLGVTADQFVVMTLLAEVKAMPQSQVVARAFSDPNTIAALLKLLEAKGWVRRARDPRDGRALRVSLTGGGRRLQKKLWRHSSALRRDLDDLFGRREREALKDMLGRVP